MIYSTDRPLWPKHQQPKRRWRPFPIYWTAGIAAVWLLFQLSGFTRDYKVIATKASVGLLVVGLLGWYVRRGRASRAVRWGLVAGVASLWLAFNAAVKIEVDGDGRFADWRWRWSPAPDETLELPLAKGDSPAVEPTIDAPEYPAFLGGGAWAEVADAKLTSDWEQDPPEELWRRPVGAGWSAFAVSQGLAVTQEQRGDQELVVAYRLETGDVAWSHGNPARFDPFGPMQAMGGIGPRATPAIHDGLVVTQGATGIVNCLDLKTGELRWSRNLNEEFAVSNLTWGKSGSPLVIADQRVAVIAVGDTEASTENLEKGHSLVALDLETGQERWSGGGRVTSYASPTLATLAGERQVLQVNQNFLTAHNAQTGAVLWEFPWPSSSGAAAACSQPVPLPEDRVFLSKGYGAGSALIQVTKNEQGQYAAEAVWRESVLKTKFGNVVVHEGHVYGIDGIVLQCVDLETGRSLWKKRRRPAFGHGQLMLVGEHLLILSEQGEIVLANARASGYEERAQLQALDESDVTWNNPALAGPYLLVRNAREAVCYRMPLEAEPESP